MEPENGKAKNVNENENKENKNADEFQKIRFATKPANTKVKTQSDMKSWQRFWIWKFEFEIGIWNVTNQMIVFSAFIQSGYRGTRHHLSIQLVSFSVLENKRVRRPFFSVLFMPYNKSFIDQASQVKIAGYWSPSLFAFLWTSTSSLSMKTQKEKEANIQPPWSRAWSIIYTYKTSLIAS